MTELSTTAAADWRIYVPASSTVIVEMYVWLEGQDPNCKNENADETFTVELFFDTAAVEEEE